MFFPPFRLPHHLRGRHLLFRCFHDGERRGRQAGTLVVRYSGCHHGSWESGGLHGRPRHRPRLWVSKSTAPGVRLVLPGWANLSCNRMWNPTCHAFHEISPVIGTEVFCFLFTNRTLLPDTPHLICRSLLKVLRGKTLDLRLLGFTSITSTVAGNREPPGSLRCRS